MTFPDRESDSDAQQCCFGLRYRALHIAEFSQEQRNEGVTDENAGLNGEEGGRINQTGGASPILYLSVVSHIPIKRPGQRGSRTGTGLQWVRSGVRRRGPEFASETS